MGYRECHCVGKLNHQLSIVHSIVFSVQSGYAGCVRRSDDTFSDVVFSIQKTSVRDHIFRPVYLAFPDSLFCCNRDQGRLAGVAVSLDTI